MQLNTIKFIEYQGTAQEWTLDELSLNSKNLIVGKNASGKSRSLNIISALAKSLAGLQPPILTGIYECQLQHEDKTYSYSLHTENQQVISEKLLINNRMYIERGTGGIGEIFAEKIGTEGILIPFQTPTSELAAVVKRDAIQHSFIEPLYTWASSLRHYHFGSSLGKDVITVFKQEGQKVDERDENAVVGIFRDGKKEFGDEFITAIKKDMACIDYHLDDVNIGTPVSIRFAGFPGEPLGLYVRERDLPGITDQYSMSQGMFRVLSLLVQVNYFQLKKTATCVLVDDIGEGLDFDRSCRLIELLRLKANHSNLQIILTTNDRFVMNHVPLEEWSILQRKGNHVAVRNYSNSREIFDDFKFTGLSNFSFLELDVINEPSSTENSSNA